jgi:hypothetical protein
MDLRQFYRKIRDTESTIPEKYPLVASLATEDGGKAGLIAEVPRYQAARMIVEGKARLATEEEKQAHQENLLAVQKAAEELEAARRFHLGLLLQPEQRQAGAKPKTGSK